jgi:hypothetical protein
VEVFSSNGTVPPPDLLNGTVLKQPRCKESMTDEEFDRIDNALAFFDTIALVYGVGSDEWDSARCKQLVKASFRRAFAPPCAADCSPLGPCDDVCEEIISEAGCGPVTSWELLQLGIEGGNIYESTIVPLVGADLAVCISDMFKYLTGGDTYDADKPPDSRRCDAARFSSEMAPERVAVGDIPYVPRAGASAARRLYEGASTKKRA